MMLSITPATSQIATSLLYGLPNSNKHNIVFTTKVKSYHVIQKTNCCVQLLIPGAQKVFSITANWLLFMLLLEVKSGYLC